ncbi:MAG: tetratricopeptide repeat protein [Planctomycetota bacterium]
MKNLIDAEISFWEKRQDHDPADFLAPEKLGEAYLQKWRDNGDAGLLKKAEKSLAKSLAIKPKHTPAMNWLASIYCQQHRFSDAITLSESVIKLDPEDGFSYGILGDCYLETGAFEKAENAYLKALELTPDMFSYARWAQFQFMKGDIPGAIEFYKQALSDAERKARGPALIAWSKIQLGQLYFRIGKIEKAEEFYQDAMKIHPGGNMPLEYLAELRAAQDKFPEAAALYEKAITISPRPETYQALGDMWAFAAQPAKAEPLIFKAADMYLESINDGNVHYYHHLASLYSDSRKLPDEALRWARKDCEIRKGVYALDSLAWAQYVKGDFKEAADSITKALAFGTRDSHLYYHASMIYFRADNVQLSREMAKKALDFNPLYTKFHAHR